MGTMIKQGRAYFFFLIIVVAGVTYQSQAIGASLSEMQSLYQLKQYEKAYQMALVLEGEHSGDAKFDFAFGMTALESGHLDQAVFAFERVLMMEPNNHRARLELARTHYFLGDYVSAKTEFNTVKQTQTPENVQKNIERFLTLIAERELKSRHSFSSEIGLNIGYDSNVNSATDNETSFLELGNLNPDDDSISHEDEFHELDLDVTYGYLLNKKTKLFSELSVHSRDNVDMDSFDTLSATAKLGASFLFSSSKLRLPLQYQHFNLDGSSFRKMLSLGAEYTAQLDTHRYLLGFVQVGEFEYPDQEVRDATFYVLGLGMIRQVGNTTFTLSVYGGVEDTDDIGEYHGRDYLGLRLRADYDLPNKHHIYAGLTTQHSNHHDDFPLQTKARKDEMYQLSLGWDWMWRPAWQLKAQASAYDNQSNIEIYTYTREVISVSVVYKMQ